MSEDDAFARWRANRPETRQVSYSTRSSAVRAAREMCRKALESPIYEAYEGPDFAIHPVSQDPFGLEHRYRYEVRGPALEALQTIDAARADEERERRAAHLVDLCRRGGAVLTEMREEELRRGPDGASLGIVSYHERSVLAVAEALETVLSKGDEIARLSALLLLLAAADRDEYQVLIGEAQRTEDEKGRSLTVLLEIAAVADSLNSEGARDLILDDRGGLSIEFRYGWNDTRSSLLSEEIVDRIDAVVSAHLAKPMADRKPSIGSSPRPRP